MKMQTTEPMEEMRVSTIESFFDLVFVFTITQLTYLVAGAHGPFDFLLVLLVLMLIWWMYDGYAWLTNAAGAGRPMRLVLIAAMAGFLVMALALPRSFGTDGLTFGLAYLFVIVLHLVAFLIKGGRSARQAMLGIAPFNLGAAALVIAAGLMHAGWNWLFFLAAVTLLAIATILRREQGFSINSAHFVERHGLVILIILGEAIVDIGTGATSRALDARTLATDARTLAAIVLSLILIAALWWSYFDRDDERARHALVAASPQARSRMALLGYWYAHLAMIAGIVLIATGVKQVVASSVGPIQEAAWLLAGGMAVYLCGDAWFRLVMGIRPVIVRAVGVAIVLPLGVVGPLWGGGAEIGAVAALAIVLLVIEQRLEPGKN
jgi:low temperature requirement protein LtrA